MMINALRAQHGDAVTRVISHLAASDQFSALVGDNIAPYRRLMTYYECAMMEVEIQLRTISMNFLASLEHQLRYKKNLSEEDITAMNTELIELAENAATLDARMQALRNFLDQAEYMN